MRERCELVKRSHRKHVYDQLAATANRSSELAPFLWHGSFSLTAIDFDNLTTVSTLKIHAVGHHFHVGGVVRHRDLVAKIKIAKNFFSGLFVGDSRTFMLAKISRYTVVMKSCALKDCSHY